VFRLAVFYPVLGAQLALQNERRIVWTVLQESLYRLLMDFVAMSADSIVRRPLFTVTMVRGSALSGGTSIFTNGSEPVTR
jgi:hypothetical protein